LDSQLEQLRKAGCNSRNIYREKVTGARPDRRELNRMLGKLGPGDVVTVTRIDRLARSTFAPVRHRQAHRGRQGAIPFPRGAVGRHRHQHRARARQGPRKGHGPPAQKKEAIRRRAQGATLEELAHSYNVSRATISRLPAA
jgi:DNA invertase Pin-like site-specific DNA recombinase